MSRLLKSCANLAVSLISRPALIFLDEPTTGLDPRTRTQMWETIRELVRRGSTIVLTTQYLEEADALADRIAVIDHGKLVSMGTPAELKSAVGGSTLSVTIKNSGQVDTAANLIDNTLHSKIETAGSTISTNLQNSNQVTTVLNQLNSKNIDITNVSVNEPSMDDVFFALTVGKN